MTLRLGNKKVCPTKLVKVEKYLVSNITKTGTVTDNKGIIGNFTPENKALTTYNPNEIVTTPFEILIKVKTGSDITTFQGLYGQSVTNKHCPQMQLIRGSSSTTRFSQILSPEGSTWGAELKYSPVLANTDYILKTVFDGSKAYLYVSENGSSLELVSTIDQSAVFWKEPICLGQDNGDEFYGTIDLNECYIKRGSEIVWEGIVPQGTRG